MSEGVNGEISSIDPAEELRAQVVAAVAAQRSGEAVPASTETGAETPPAAETPAKEAGAETPAADRKDGRDANGRFAPKEGAEPAKAPSATESEKAPDLSTDAQKVGPPPRLGVSTKAMWEQLPENVRADLVKREADVDASLTRYSGLAPFADQAVRNGTTLQEAVKDYAAVETALRSDIGQGVEFVIKRMGHDPRAVVAHLAAQYGITAQAGNPAPDQRVDQSPRIDPAEIKSQVMQEVRSEQQNERLRAEVDQFKADPKNKYFENVRPIMSQLAAAGLADSVQEAYDKACKLHPEIAALVSQTQAPGASKANAVAQAKAAARSVGGAPPAGFRADAGKARDPNQSTEDTVRAAVLAQRER